MLLKACKTIPALALKCQFSHVMNKLLTKKPLFYFVNESVNKITLNRTILYRG